MRGLLAVFAVALLGHAAPLFNASEPARLHTSLATLLPMLPLLAPPPSHTLVVTLATAAFKPLLLNWMCSLKFQAKWGAPSDAPPFLVVTSEEALARELSAHGVVVWWLRGADLDADEREDGDDLLLHDEYRNLRLLGLLLAPGSAADDPRQEMLRWGSLHYQSLMLERSLVLSSLVGALAASQTVDVDYRKQQERKWMARAMAHDWSESILEREPWVGVKGVLVVDNDAVWLSSPSSHLAHPYRPDGTHPSFIYAPDMPPSTTNSWGTHEMPCACFLYSRTSDAGAHEAVGLNDDPEDYSPSEGAALGWRYTALCHIAMLLKSLEEGRRLATQRDAFASDDLLQLHHARAPSFQATSLGPALYLASRAVPVLPPISQARWRTALGSGNIADLLDLLEEAGLGDDGTTCVELAERNHDVCAVPPPSSLPPRTPHRPIRAEPLPYASFPPGMSYFAHDQEAGIQPCVVHANYALGPEKESLLRAEGLWALDDDGASCTF